MESLEYIDAHFCVVVAQQREEEAQDVVVGVLLPEYRRERQQRLGEGGAYIVSVVVHDGLDQRDDLADDVFSVQVRDQRSDVLRRHALELREPGAPLSRRRPGTSRSTAG